MPDHTFNPILARDYGTDVAIFLQNIWFWVKRNKAYDENFHEGLYWTFNSLSAFTDVHFYWSKRQIERIVSTCKKEELLLSGCFNKDRRDRTCWYTLSDKALAYFTNDTTKTEVCISPNGDMHVTERGQSCHRSVTTIPDIKPDIKHIPPIVPQGTDVLFDRFWAAYPKKKAKQDAMKAWAKLNPDMALCREMSAALKWQKQSEQWTRDGGQYIPHPGKWLRQRLWEDEPDKPSGGSDPYKDEGEDGI